MSYNFSKAHQEQEAILNWLKAEYRSIQTGRATPQVLDLVHIDLYGLVLLLLILVALQLKILAPFVFLLGTKLL